MKTVSVSIPNTFFDAFDYDASGLNLAPGMRVVVPFGKKKRVGFVMGEATPKENIELKSVLECLEDEVLLSSDVLSLCRWVAQYYQTPLSQVLPLALPKALREGRPLLSVSKKQEKEAKKIVAVPILNEMQQKAVDAFYQKSDSYHCFLLEGVTGSGKTEVYFRAIQKVLSHQKQVLMLVPEIGLTPQLIQRFKSRFSATIAVIHSGLTDKKRYEAFCLAKTAEAEIVIGTRTAIFTPMPNLGLIVVDEEHDASFKQMEGVRYSARDTALVRANFLNIPVILGSATPSLETLNNAFKNKYTHLALPEKAVSKTPLRYQLVDLRNQYSEHGLSRQAIDAIRAHLKNGFQVFVFINRRGFSPVVLCHACGCMEDCSACDSHLTFHQKLNRLICHHCSRTWKLPSKCKKCQSETLIPIGTGTERIYDALLSLFPDTNILKFDRDEVRKKTIATPLKKIETGEVSLIVGTQMLAKGHHFPKLTLVVVVDADSGLMHPEFRASEQFGQLLLQVAGRAGREEHPGTVLIQTHYPQHPLLNLLVREGYGAFATALLHLRKEANFPPYGYLALIRAQHKKEERVMKFLSLAKGYLLNFELKTMGPSEAPMARKALFYRGQLLIQATKRQDIQRALTSLRTWLTMNKLTSGIRFSIDVDPLDLS